MVTPECKSLESTMHVIYDNMDIWNMVTNIKKNAITKVFRINRNCL